MWLRSLIAVTVLALAGYAAWLPMARKFRLFHRFWRPDWHAMGQVFRLGLPIGLTALAESGLFQAVALMMGWIGTVELAAHGIAMQITAVGFMVHVGLSNAVTVRVGRFAGAGEWAAARRTGKVAIGLSALVACGQVVIYLTLAAPIDDAATLRRMAGLCLKRAPLAQRLRLLGVRVGALSKTGAAGVQEEVGGAASLFSRRPGGKGHLADPYTAPLF